MEELQSREGLTLANKLKKRHINWKSEKMKVSLAAQVLSESVASALEYCQDYLKLPQFQGCGPTVRLISTFNNLFDVLNSINTFGKGSKSPIREDNQIQWKTILKHSRDYILGLTNLDGKSMLKTQR